MIGAWTQPIEIPEAFVGSPDECLRLIESQVDQLIEAAPCFLRELRSGASQG